ncbi:unnamed protein product [Phaedon cochleariae]|uniref:Lipocalin/cytosolic fatty-acid binding domain-containing protein n=1 Tax=Phaedon cochleariae TaxID=80249 RepID=A0A9N9X1U3_PHACE|nr:unnamed protein product [Phaedon cochleariae]
MSRIEGKYTNYKNENLDEYFKGLGVPYVPRKMMCASHPSLEISKEENAFVVTVSSLMRTSVSKFKLGEDYEEEMPGGTLKNITTLEGDNKMITKSVGPGEVKSTREYDFKDDECIITYTTDKTPAIAKRYYKKN